MARFRRLLYVLLIGGVMLILEGGLLRPLLPPYLTPNLSVVIVVYLGFFEVSAIGAFIAFLLGLELDIASAVLLGPWAGAFVAVYGFIAALAQRIFVESPLTSFVAAAAASLIAGLVHAVLLYQFKPLHGNLFELSLLEAIVTGVCAVPLMYLLQRLIGKVDSGSTTAGF